MLALGVLLGLGLEASRVPPPPAAASVAASPIWAPLLDDDMPILVVVGDYYIFGELDDHGDVARLVRDFNVGSRAELDELMKREPKVASRYLNLDLTYLPTGSAYALVDVLRVLYTSEKPIHVVSMSEMSDADLKTSHIVYLGYISGLSKLEDFVFASSNLAIGYTYDELRNTETGEMYASEAGLPEANRNYRDYALVSTFPGPGGNQFVIVSGTRDAGMMQAAHALSDPMFMKSIEQARPDANSSPAAVVRNAIRGHGLWAHQPRSAPRVLRQAELRRDLGRQLPAHPRVVSVESVQRARGRATSASMQRTLPPPTRSIVVTSAATSRPCRSSWCRPAASSDSSAAADKAMTGPSLPRSSSRLPANASSCAKVRSMISRPVLSRRCEHGTTFRRGGDGLSAERRESRPDREQDVRVVDRPAGAIRGAKRHDLVVEPALELGERRRVRARRQARVRDVPLAIEHEAAGAFQGLAAVLEGREIDDSIDLVSMLVAERLE